MEHIILFPVLSILITLQIIWWYSKMLHKDTWEFKTKQNNNITNKNNNIVILDKIILD